jgi:hypothetical protein
MAPWQMSGEIPPPWAMGQAAPPVVPAQTGGWWAVLAGIAIGVLLAPVLLAPMQKFYTPSGLK